MRTAIFPAHFDQLDAIRQFATQAALDAGMDADGECAVEMAVDEACSNIIEHAYKGVRTGELEITCDSDGEYLTIILRDHGIPFNVLEVSVPDLSAGLEERRVGGLGIYLMRTLMDKVNYEQLGTAGNLLTMVRKLKSKDESRTDYPICSVD
jgi:serine/threonine-protein kinase RsbW